MTSALCKGYVCVLMCILHVNVRMLVNVHEPVYDILGVMCAGIYSMYSCVCVRELMYTCPHLVNLILADDHIYCPMDGFPVIDSSLFLWLHCKSVLCRLARGR